MHLPYLTDSLGLEMTKQAIFAHVSSAGPRTVEPVLRVVAL